MPTVPTARVRDSYPEAAGRGPLCALALHRGGRGKTDDLRKALVSFVEQHAGFKKEWHKALCHTSPEGFGSHYIFYDYLFASAAARASANAAPTC